MMSNEKQTFEFYYNLLYQQAYGYILKRVPDRYVAEDLLMEAFLSCYKKFDQFDPCKASFQTWLYVVVNNKLKNYYRDQKGYDNVDECMEYVESFEDDLIAAESLKGLRDALAKALETLSEPLDNEYSEGILLFDATVER